MYDGSLAPDAPLASDLMRGQTRDSARPEWQILEELLDLDLADLTQPRLETVEEPQRVEVRNATQVELGGEPLHV